jgi:DNA-binding NtrC family response regulator
MPLAMQAKLLRVLEEGELERVGGDRPMAVDVRVVVATHRNLEALVKQGSFRQDLFHRIYVFPVILPPLRERVEDIPALVDHFARQVAEQNGWKPKRFDSKAIQALERYHWPGNVRELRNVVERLLLLADEAVDEESVELALPHLQPAELALPAAAAGGTLAERVEAFERELVLAELKRQKYHMTETAKTLGLERSHLYKKCQQLGVDLRAVKKNEN